MPEVTVDVAGRSYRLGCGEGEEQHLAGLAALVDAEATKLGHSLGQMNEGRLMLMSALMLADRLAEMAAALEAAEQRAEEAEKLAESAAPNEMFNQEREAEIAASLTALAERIETLVERIDGAE